jgi:saccharopine dehydrogenase-like NADP-dependent oxidoreductase
LQDAVIVFVAVTGRKNGRLVQETYANKIYGREVDGRVLTAIQLSTAAGICAVLDLLAAGRLVRAGLVRQEDVPLPLFLENRFGRIYERVYDGARPA